MRLELRILIGKVEECIEIKDFEKLNDVLIKIWELNDSSCIPAIALLIEDDYEFDEVMYSLVHFIEEFDLETYIKHILSITPKLFEKSPDWSRTLIVRIRNNQKGLKFYESYIGSISREQKKLLHKIINKMDLPVPK